jgi:hypothetical protein
MDADASGGEFWRRTNANVLQDGKTCPHFLCLSRYTTWICIVARLQVLSSLARVNACMKSRTRAQALAKLAEMRLWVVAQQRLRTANAAFQLIEMGRKQLIANPL